MKDEPVNEAESLGLGHRAGNLTLRRLGGNPQGAFFYYKLMDCTFDQRAFAYTGFGASAIRDARLNDLVNMAISPLASRGHSDSGRSQ